jgi:hypothetical protein
MLKSNNKKTIIDTIKFNIEKDIAITLMFIGKIELFLET